MDISKASIEQKRLWLQQRGWEPHPDKTNVFIDPDTRVNYFIEVAVKRALADCHIEDDTQLKPAAPPRRDDAPWPKTKTG